MLETFASVGDWTPVLPLAGTNVPTASQLSETVFDVRTMQLLLVDRHCEKLILCLNYCAWNGDSSP